MKTVVIYKSKTGYTEKYAKWIAEELDCDLMENTGLKIDDISEYDIIICGGGIYIGKMAGIKFIKKNYERLKDKKIILWACGTGLGNEDMLENFWEKNLSKDQLENVKYYYFSGGFNYNKLGALDKFLMESFKRSIEKKEDNDDDMKGFLQDFYTPQDNCDKDNIKPLIDYVETIAK